MMIKFAGEFVTVLGTGEQFQRPFPSCFRYERLDKSRFVRVHARTVHRELILGRDQMSLQRAHRFAE